ncbi:hypothetical protein Tco_1285071 [Tanacetum coccineum]
MHTSKDDYLINTLRFVSRKEASQKYGAVLPECLTSSAMKESKAYKTYLGYATGVVPPKAAKKFKKASPSKKDNVPIPEDEEPIKKGKRLKTAAKKFAYKPAIGYVIREPVVETKSKRKEKEKVDVAHGKGIELLSDVALTEEAQKEVRIKSLRDFHKTHPSGSGTVIEDSPSVAKITPPVTSEGTGDILGVPNVTNDDSSKSESESWGNDEDESNEEHVLSDEGSEEENESDKQASDSEQEEESKDDDHKENKDDDDLELESNDETEGDEEKDDTTDQFDDDVDARLEEPTKTAIGIVQGEGTDAKMTKSQQGNENLETTQEQVVEDAHVTISTITKRTEVLVTSSSRSSDLASKFLNFSDIPHTDAEIVSSLDVPVHHEVPRTQAPTLLLILHGQNDKDKDEDPSAGSNRGLKRRKTSKDAKPTTDPKKKDSTYGSSKDQEGDKGDNEDEPRKETSSGSDWFKKPTPVQEPTDPDWHDFDELMSTPIDFFAFIMNGLNISNLTQETLLGPAFRLLKVTSGDYLFDLSKPLPLITRGKCQKVPFEFFINNDLKYLQGGISAMTYMTSTTKTKAAQYDLPSIEDMVPNIWSPVKRYAIKGRYVFDKAYSGSHSCLGNEEIWIQNRVNNLLGDDVADFAIALRMYTRSLVIQKRVEDLQLGFESYQKKINVTNPDTTRLDLQKRHPYTPYKDP